MKTEPILSPTEVRALLDGASAKRHAGLRLDAESIDLLASDRALQQMIPALSVGYVRVSEAWRRVVTSVLRRKVEIHDEAPEILTGRGLAQVTAKAAAIVALRTEVCGQDRGYVLLCLDPVLAYSVLERLFGSSREESTAPTERRATALERRMLLRALGPCVDALDAALEPPGCFRFVAERVEHQLELIKGFAPDATVLHVPFTLKLGERLASMSLAIPGHALEPLRPLLAQSVQDGPDGMRMEALVRDTPVRLSVELGRSRVGLRQVLELQPGMILPLDSHPSEELPVKVEGVEKFRGYPVHDQGALAIEITRHSRREKREN